MPSESCLFLSTEHYDPVSATIRWYTNCDWSHCGWLRLADNWTYSAMSDGKGVDWRPPNPRAKILKLSAPGTDEALQLALVVRGAKYDLKDILGIAFSKNWYTQGDYICDKLTFWFQDKANFPLVNHKFIPFEHLRPRDILL